MWRNSLFYLTVSEILSNMDGFLLFVSKPVMGQNIIEAEKNIQEAAYRTQLGSRRIKEGTRQDLAPEGMLPVFVLLGTTLYSV